MATKTKSRRTIPARRPTGNRKLAKLKVSAARRSAKNRSERAQRRGDVVAVVASALLGYADREGWTDKIPAIGELGAPAVAGIALYAAPMLVKGSTGETLQRAGTGLLSVAAYQFAEEFEGFGE